MWAERGTPAMGVSNRQMMQITMSSVCTDSSAARRVRSVSVQPRATTPMLARTMSIDISSHLALSR